MQGGAASMHIPLQSTIKIFDAGPGVFTFTARGHDLKQGQEIPMQCVPEMVSLLYQTYSVLWSYRAD